MVASAVALAVFLVQIAVGGVVALVGDAGWAAVLHVGARRGLARRAVVAAAFAFRGGVSAPSGSVRDYVTLTKPRIMTLLLL